MIFNKILRKLLCLLGGHDWTAKVLENIPPSEDEVRYAIYGGFWKYSRMYCKHCKRYSSLNEADMFFHNIPHDIGGNMVMYKIHSSLTHDAGPR